MVMEVREFYRNSFKEDTATYAMTEDSILQGVAHVLGAVVKDAIRAPPPEDQRRNNRLGTPSSSTEGDMGMEDH